MNLPKYVKKHMAVKKTISQQHLLTLSTYFPNLKLFFMLPTDATLYS